MQLTSGVEAPLTASTSQWSPQQFPQALHGPALGAGLAAPDCPLPAVLVLQTFTKPLCGAGSSSLKRGC